ncbi:AfsR/SARP family transcriptional regulator [Pseudonocardia humida]|uniref:ATP-binding protein n=1 Tax=Pseudonocardia humida TaxID=2800819 RepID=A0ABT1ADT4_9PSEU|nr:AAA family ATPase [Pseudonocardia humida]MCO1661163.1 ATP-binding protein [Pseudonocardia humida]
MVDDELRVIGNVELRAGGELVELAPQLAKALAVLVAARPGQGVPRADLVDALWPAAPDTDRLWPVVSKLRLALRRVGLTVTSGRGNAGYRLEPLPGPGGVEPAAILDTTAVVALTDRAERLLEDADPAEAARVLAGAAARWRGEPFTVGDDWPLPRICRLAAQRLDTQQRRLAKLWVRADLLTADFAALDWIDQDKALAAALDGDREVWLLRFLSTLVENGAPAAEAMLEELRPRWGYEDPTVARAAQLIELGEHGAVPVPPPIPQAAEPGPHRAALEAFVASIRAREAELLNVVGPTGPARLATVDELAALAAAAGVWVVREVCDAADDLAPGRQLMRDLWAAALTDPRFAPDTDRALLTNLVASPRPSGGFRPAKPNRLVDAAVGVVSALARNRPVLVVIDDAHRMTALAAELTEQIRSRLSGAAVGFCVAGADPGPFAGRAGGTVLAVAGEPGAPQPTVSDWLAAAAVTAVDLRIDPVVVTAVLGVRAERADAGLALAVRTGAVVADDGVRFARAAARDAVLAQLAAEPGRARRLHAAAYRHLAGTPDVDLAGAARHALAARPDVPDDEVAAACLAAARGEHDVRRLDTAIELATRGLALTADPALRFALHIAQGDARHDRADMHAAETAFRAAYEEAGGCPRQRAVAAIRLGRRWTDPGRVDRSLLHMLGTARDELVASAELDADREAHELWLLLNATLAHWTTMGLLPDGPVLEDPEPVVLARATLDALIPDTDPEVACEVLTECRYALFDYAPPAELRRISARMEEVSAAATSALFRGEALMQSVVDHLRLGDMIAAHRTSELHRALVEETAAGMGPWSQLSLDTVFDLWDGDLADAEARILGPQKAMLEENQRDVSDSMQQTWMGQLSWLRYQQGRMPELAGILRLAERRQYFVLWAPAIALMWGEVEQPAAAVDQLAATLDLTADLRALPPHGLAVPTLAVAAEAINSLDGFRNDRLDVDGLARRVDALLEPHTEEIALGGWPTLLVGPVHRARGLLALALGEPDRALEHFDLGIRKVGASAGQLAWLRLHQGRALIARGGPGDARRAREVLEAALDTATAKGLGALAPRARRHLDALSG